MKKGLVFFGICTALMNSSSWAAVEHLTGLAGDPCESEVTAILSGFARAYSKDRVVLTLLSDGSRHRLSYNGVYPFSIKTKSEIINTYNLYLNPENCTFQEIEFTQSGA